MKRVLFGLLLACMILSLFISCGRRDNPIRSEYPFQEPWRTSRDWVSLQGNAVLDPSIRDVYVYLPSWYDADGPHGAQLLNEGFSVLYLLHDLGGDFSTFVSVHKIGQLADRLIEEGEIQPMIIVMPDASSLSVGGSFYTNSPLLGNYEDYILKELMARMDTLLHTYGSKPGNDWIPDPRYRAIGGLGMGAYGALRMAMDYDTTKFTAVSAMSPFASLESFLTRETIDSMFKENGILDDFSYSAYKTLNPWPDEDHPDKTYSQLVFAMAASFSPRSTTGDDTTNFFTLAVEGALRHGVDLPFDESRTIPPGSQIWNRWLQYDVKTKLANDPDAFTDLNIYVECGDHNEFGLLDGTRALDQLLSLYGQEHTYIEYSGYPNNPAGHDNFIYDRLEEVLKFHSDHFPPPAYRGVD
ncbi:MAG: alpha/beta hydrolase-fold protein [Candidatus Zixiibacteriota bacterium]